MAIQLRTTLTVRPREDHYVRLANAEPSYADVVLELSRDVEPGAPGAPGRPGEAGEPSDRVNRGDRGDRDDRGDRGDCGDWGDYARGVAQALVRDYGITVGADIAVESDLPIAAGLSSSSALSSAWPWRSWP